MLIILINIRDQIKDKVAMRTVSMGSKCNSRSVMPCLMCLKSTILSRFVP